MECTVCNGEGTYSTWTNVQGAAIYSAECFKCNGTGKIEGEEMKTLDDL